MRNNTSGEIRRCISLNLGIVVRFPSQQQFKLSSAKEEEDACGENPPEPHLVETAESC